MTLYEADNIAAIITAPGKAGMAAVRISGPDSLEIADKVFSSPAPPPSARIDVARDGPMECAEAFAPA